MVVVKVRNNKTLTESGYWGLVRSTLRRGFRFWKPMMIVKQENRRKYVGLNKRQKWEYQCNVCKGWFKDKEIQVDHIIPVGSLKCSEDLARFLERLTPEQGFQVLCKEDHKKKTLKERGII